VREYGKASESEREKEREKEREREREIPNSALRSNENVDGLRA
jgi:hypothetical protein